MRTKIVSTIIIIFLLIGGLIYWEYYQEQGFLRVGIEQPSVVAFFETSLASKITSTATSMTLVSGTDKDGNSISGKFGMVIDEGSSDEEVIIADCSGTTCTGMLRGISVTTGNTEVTALKKTHRRGASIKITDYPILTILQQLTSGSASFEDLLYYAETIGTTGFASVASSSNIASKYYVDYVGASGFTAANVGTNDGLIALGTSPETVGVNIASSSALYFLSTTGDLAVYTSASMGLALDDYGRLFVNASDSFDWTGTNTYSGTNTFTGTLEFSTTASTSILTLDTALDEIYGGTGTVSWDKYDIPYLSADNIFNNLASAADGFVLRYAEGAPSFGTYFSSDNYIGSYASTSTCINGEKGEGSIDIDNKSSLCVLYGTYPAPGNKENYEITLFRFGKVIGYFDNVAANDNTWISWTFDGSNDEIDVNPNCTPDAQTYTWTYTIYCYK